MNAPTLTLIVNAEVYDPEPRGRQQLLLGGGQVLAMDERIDIGGGAVSTIDADGALLIPGFVDALTHPCGGGGEGGFGNRTGEVDVETFVLAGVTSPIGALGTDSLTRSLDVLYGTTRQLRARGLDALMYTGAYRVPAPTFTGDIARDLTLLPSVIGVGEVAISDHRSAQPTAQELRRIAADAQLGGILAGRGGTVMLHLGDGPAGLEPMHAAMAGTDLPASAFYPTHVNRDRALLEQAIAFAREGGYIDITASTTPELVEAGDIPALVALELALAEGVPPSQLTLSSDAGGSLPVYVDGELTGLTAARPGILLQTLQQAITEAPDLLYPVLAAITRNPAAALRLPGLGQLAVGSAATLLLLQRDSGVLTDLCCRGRWLLRNGETITMQPHV
jgi:beta-aspartyl-dipeptidase (metallo-type)